MAIDRTPEEQEEYNRLKKDIIKDIKKETRKGLILSYIFGNF
jgi:hypothetical protein